MEILKSTTSKWKEENGIIYFSVTSNNMLGTDWLDLFAETGVYADKGTRFVLESDYFNSQVTDGITTKVAVFKEDSFVRENNTQNLLRISQFKQLRPETICLICNLFTLEDFKEMGLREIMLISEPHKVSYAPDEMLLRTGYYSKNDQVFLLSRHIGIAGDNHFYKRTSIADSKKGFAFEVA